MLSANTIAERYQRAPSVGLEIGATTDAVYRLLQRGILKGVCENGRWYVERESVRCYLAARHSAPTAPSAA